MKAPTYREIVVYRRVKPFIPVPASLTVEETDEVKRGEQFFFASYNHSSYHVLIPSCYSDVEFGSVLTQLAEYLTQLNSERNVRPWGKT